MFGGGFAVGVAINRAEPPGTGGALGLAERPSRLGEVLPPSRRSDAEIAADLERMTAIEGALAAWRCQLVDELAARRPASADSSPIDPAPTTPGGPTASLQGPAPSVRGVGGREVLRLCRRHHRLTTHARGWRFVMDPDGTLHVITPSGVTRTERPPGLHPPDPPPF